MYLYHEKIDLCDKNLQWHIDKSIKNNLFLVNEEDCIFHIIDNYQDKKMYYQMGAIYQDYTNETLQKQASLSPSEYELNIKLEILNNNNLQIHLYFFIYDETKKLINRTYKLLYNGNNIISIKAPLHTTSFRIFFGFNGAGTVRCKKCILRTPIKNEEDLYPYFEMMKNTNQKLIDELKKAYITQINLENSYEYKLGSAVKNIFKSPIKALGMLIKVNAARRKGNKLSKTRQEKQNRLLQYADDFNKFSYAKQSISYPDFKPKKIPESFKLNLNIGVIMDTFSYECFRYEANLIRLSRNNYKSEILENNIQIIILESCWGDNVDWKFAMSSSENNDKKIDLYALIDYAKKQKIKVVFLNKEDPINFNKFINIAKKCDYIFTSDENCIDKYKDMVSSHTNIYPIMFAAAPLIHNPIRDKKLQIYDVCFAGSWYDGDSFKERNKDIQMLFDAAINFNFHIFDRMHNSKENTTNRIFPQKYHKFIVGNLDYPKMLNAYRQYRVFLNVNSVTDSNTMFSRRIFELLACKTSIISSKSSGLQKHFSGFIDIVNTSQEAQKAIQNKIETNQQNGIIKHIGMREIYKNHTYSKRLTYILDKIGVKYECKKELFICVSITNRPNYIDNIIKNYTNQIYSNKKLVLVLNSNSFNIDKIENKLKNLDIDYEIFQTDPKTSLGTCFNMVVDKFEADFYAKMDDDDYYGPNYLSDSLDAFKYSGADVLGKQSVYTYVEATNKLYMRFGGNDHKYTDFVTGASLIIKKDVFTQVKFKELNKGEDTNFLKDAKSKGYIIFSSDMYNFICTRRSDISSHTWQIELDDYLKNCQYVCDGLNMDIVNI
ncbi:glycosyltransferase [Campylobacter sp. CX2-4080-23]|uniref:glycosyltransferase family protein n=1 Tax=Campylobacter porcelli TaxID=1660073 RepID=UPI002EBC2EF3|nr:glycosyltransferase [Campylobacter sp. CX2-4080-23]